MYFEDLQDIRYKKSEKKREQYNDYIEYKKLCDTMEKNIKCEYKNIDNMNSIELNNYIQQLLKLKHNSNQCYIKRLQFQKKWIPEYKRDSGHFFAIERAKNFEILCKTVLEKVNERKNYLMQNLLELQRGLTELELSDIQDDLESGTESFSETESISDIDSIYTTPYSEFYTDTEEDF